MKLDDAVREHVLKILSVCKTKNEAANVLGVSGRTLRNYLDKWGVGFEDRRRVDAHLEQVDSYRSITPEERDKFENMDYY